MTRRLLLVGAGGFGREVLSTIRGTHWPYRDWELGGFLDGNPAALDPFHCDCPIIGDPADYVPRQDDVFLCTIGDPATKLAVAKALLAHGAQFISLVHPAAMAGERSHYGPGLIMMPLAALSTDVRLGSFVTINSYSGFGHNSQAGDGCTLSAHCDVTGNAVLGEGVLMGSHASVLPGVRVGDYAVVGAGSVAVRTVPPYSTVMGVPARQIRWPAASESAGGAR